MVFVICVQICIPSCIQSINKYHRIYPLFICTTIMQRICKDAKNRWRSRFLGIGRQGSPSSNIVRMNVRLSLSHEILRAGVLFLFVIVNRESREQLVNPVISLAATIASHFLLQLSRDTIVR